jgi:hypothetical protein
MNIEHPLNPGDFMMRTYVNYGERTRILTHPGYCSRLVGLEQLQGKSTTQEWQKVVLSSISNQFTDVQDDVLQSS